MGNLWDYGSISPPATDTDLVPIFHNNQTKDISVGNLLKDRTTTLVIGTTGQSGDYICSGTNDDVTIQAAINAATANTKIIIRNGTYNLGAKLLSPSNMTIEGESKVGTVLRMVSGKNLTVFGNSDTTNGNSFIHLKNMTIDQQGILQAGGGGMSFTGLSDSIFENIRIKTSWTFNFFVSSVPGTTLTGTATFTNGSETVVGSGTVFTSQVSKYSILKSANNQFARVLSITDDTHIVLDRPWGWITENGVSFKLVASNARNRLLNCTFEGNSQNDNVGLGLLDDSLVEGCITHDSNGYGFGPDHTNRTKFIGNTSYNNPNSGIGMETCGYCAIVGNEFYKNGIGINMLSGAYRNIISSNNVLDSTAKGIGVGYNATTFPPANENSIIGNTVTGTTGGTGDGIYVSGIDKTAVIGNRCSNNARGGVVLALGSSTAPTNTLITNNYCYDNQTTKTQQYGIWIASGTNTAIFNNFSRNADNLTNGILDSGTLTTLANNIT
jgi:parallel beta-helix repeat protein